MKGGPGSFADTEYSTNKEPKPLSGLPYAGILVQQLVGQEFQLRPAYLWILTDKRKDKEQIYLQFLQDNYWKGRHEWSEAFVREWSTVYQKGKSVFAVIFVFTMHFSDSLHV